MADVFKTIKITQATPGGPLQQTLVGAITATTGAADAGKVILTNASGQLDASFGGGGGGTTVQVNGSIVADPNFNGTTPAAPGGFTNVIWQTDLSGNVSAYYSASGGGSSAFNAITTGTNTTATMTVGTGGTLTFSGSGVVNANELKSIGITNTPAHEGQLLIVQPGLTTLAYADPLVQGLYAAGSPIASPTFVTPTTIQPVLVGASDGTTLRNIASDASGQVKVLVQNTPSVTVTSGSITVSGTVAATQSGSWTVAATQSGSWSVGVTGTVTVSGTVAATQSGTWNIGTLATVTNPVTVAQTTAANLNATVVGTVAVSSVSGTVTVVQPTAANLNATVTGTVAATQSGSWNVTVSGTVAATQSGTWNIGTVTTVSTISNPVTVAQATAANLNATVTGTVAATQSGSWTVTANAGSGTFQTQDTSNGATGSAVPARAIYFAGNKSGNLTGVSLDGSGNLNVNVAAGSSGNSAASATGSAVPADADYQGINVGGNLTGVTGFNLGSTIAEAVAIVDGSGVQITSFGGGAQFAMGSTQSSSALGTIALGYDGTAVRGLLTSTTGQLHTIVDSSGTLTVTGTVTANIGTTGGLALDATLTGGTAKTQMFDGTNTIGTSAHPVRTDPTGTTSQPVVGTQSDNSTNSTAKLPVISAVASASAPTYTAGHQVPLSVDLSGNLRTSGGGGGGSSVTLDVNATPLFTRALVNIGSAGNTTIIAGVSTQIIRIYRMTLVIQTATTIAFQDTAATNLFPATPVTAASTFSGEFDTQPKFIVAVNEGFVINLSVGSVVTGFIDFTQS